MMAKLFALLNHPVTQAIIDIGQYAARRHIIPAVNRGAEPPTQEDVQETAGEYAMPTDDEIAAAEIAAAEIVEPEPTEESANETPSGKTNRKAGRVSQDAQ